MKSRRTHLWSTEQSGDILICILLTGRREGEIICIIHLYLGVFIISSINLKGNNAEDRFWGRWILLVFSLDLGMVLLR